MKAFITGVTGQDGHYLTEFLKNKGYDVYGLVRRSSQPRSIPDCEIVIGDVTDTSVVDDVRAIKPDEIYNLAAMSHVADSFKIPEYTFNVNAMGTLNMLEAALNVDAKFYQASTSELFGTEPPPQDEGTRFHPRSPYGVAKLAAFFMTVNYREAYGLRAYNGILFNHESPLRGKDFVTQKIAEGVARIHLGLDDHITLGNLEACRDWGHAKDYVRGMWHIMNDNRVEPSDYVLATGQLAAVKDFCAFAFEHVGLKWQDYVRTDKKFLRPAEVPSLCGNPSKIERLGWRREYNLRDIIEEMVDAAIERFKP